ncbi:MAG: hypothetical protein IJJ33_01095 [Victivallales bacterium]|nr:hypothetical protein [Victivallales bacterium]
MKEHLPALFSNDSLSNGDDRERGLPDPPPAPGFRAWFGRPCSARQIRRLASASGWGIAPYPCPLR